MIHVVLIATGKVIIDVIPGVTQNISWTTVNLSYLAVRSLSYFSTSLTAHSYSHNCPPVFLPYVSLGNGHPLRERTTRWGLRRPHSLGADRRRCTKHTLKKMALLCSRRPVRCPPLFPPTDAHTTTNPKQFPPFDTLHELQPMAFCDQPVSLNICTCSQAAYGASHVVGC